MSEAELPQAKSLHEVAQAAADQRDFMTSVYDSKAGRFMPPQASVNLDLAIRAFGDLCNQEGTVFQKHPADFDLFHVGFWDGESAELFKIPRVHVVSGNAFRETV